MTIAVTTGDPAGIGADLVVINAQQKCVQNLLIFTDPALLTARAKKLNLPLKIIEDSATTKPGEVCVFPIKTATKAEAGVLNADNVPFVLKTLNTAVQFCLKDKKNALLTGPVHKGIINQVGIDFSGHTEYLARLTKCDKAVMMLATNKLKVALATTHLPLAKVAENIQTKSLQKTISIIHQFLLSSGIKQPKILVCGLNPHAGESGFLGREEIEIINPLINRLNSKGYHLIGSVAADTAFTPDSLADIDLVLAMYHDQGLTALKTLGFQKSVNITLGLPFVRTSVDHGTALDLAGTGKISLGSLAFALKYTQKLLAYAKI